MRPKSTLLDLPSSYDVKLYIHNQFVKHIKCLKEEITVREFILYNYKVLTQAGCPREGLHNRRWLVRGYNENRVPGDDRTLDRGEGWKMEDAGGSDWI